MTFTGAPTSNTAIAGGVNGNVGTGLFANASLPSGHTTFGYTTSILFAMLVPERFQQLVTRASEYGDSRIVLGVHYPIDIIAGRALASYDIAQMLNNNPRYLNATVNGVFGIGDLTTTGNFQTVFTAAQTDVRNLFTTNCGTDIATCAATGAPDRFSNAAANQANISRASPMVCRPCHSRRHRVKLRQPADRMRRSCSPPSMAATRRRPKRSRRTAACSAA